jgi:hypothetical protein
MDNNDYSEGEFVYGKSLKPNLILRSWLCADNEFESIKIYRRPVVENILIAV